MSERQVNFLEILILGAGKLGTRIAEALSEGNHSITIVDKDSDVVNRINQQLDVMTVHGDGRDTGLLKELKIAGFDFFIAVTDSDETNIITASFAKKMGAHMVMARVRDPEHMNQMEFIKETFYIDVTLNPDLAITNEIYKYLVEKYTLSNGVYTSGRFSLLEFKAQRIPSVIGKNMIHLRNMYPDLLVIAISKKGKIIIPHGEDVINADDFVYMAGDKDDIALLNKKVHERGKFTNISKVMIIGGGKTGFYLGKKLSEFGASVKIIEKNKARSQALSTQLKNVMVLHGDGTDIEMLLDENLDDMDAFVTSTGFDEENLLLALTAKNHNIKDVIAKVSHESYTSLIEKMGVDMVLNPLDITAGNVFRIVQGDKKILSAVLIQGQAELMEIIAHDDMYMCNTKIADLDLPDDVLISGIRRGNDFIIPDGDTVIISGDRVIILGLLSALEELERLLKKKDILVI